MRNLHQIVIFLMVLSVVITHAKVPLVIYYMYNIVSDQPYPRFSSGTEPLAEVVIPKILASSGKLPNYAVEIHARGTTYMDDKDMGKVIEIFYKEVLQIVTPSSAQNTLAQNAPILFGPQSSNEAKIIGQLAPLYNLVTISSEVGSGELATNHHLYPNFFRTTLSSDAYQYIPRTLLAYLNYTTVGIIYQDGTLGTDISQAVELDLLSAGYNVLYKQNFDYENNSTFKTFTTNIQLFDPRIFVIFSQYGEDYNMFCDAIRTLGPGQLTSEKYLTIWLYIDVGTALVTFQPGNKKLPPDCTQSMLDQFLMGSFIAELPSYDKTYTGAIDMGGLTVEQLQQRVLVESQRAPYGDSTKTLEQLTDATLNGADMLWAGILALDAVDKRISLTTYATKPADLAAAVLDEMGKLKFRGATGTVAFNPKTGGLMVDIPIIQYTGEKFTTRFSYLQKESALSLISEPVFATHDGRPPLDKKPAPTPYDEAAAQRQLIAIIVSAVAVIVFIVCVAMLGVWWNNVRKLAKALKHPVWLFLREQVKMRTAGVGGAASMIEGGGGGGGYSMSMMRGSQASSKVPVVLTAVINEGEMTVKMQAVSPDATKLQINEKTHKIMLNFRDTLLHGNVVRFVGYCLFDFDAATNVCEQYLMWEHCEKGPLTELIDNKAFKLDSIFEFAILTDIAQGMAFLHQSKQLSIIGGAHGKLSPDTCYIDKRFSVKVSDHGEKVLATLFNLNDLRTSANINAANDDPSSNVHKLYWAPEILRQNLDLPKGTPAGDVYAFGMSIYNLITRSAPFASESNSFTKLTANTDVLDFIRTQRTPPMRPTLLAVPSDGENARDARLLTLMQRCWSEEPSERPVFNEISSQLRTMSRVKGKASASLTDQLLTRLERYASDMEGLVGERTMELEREKKKSEELLHQILPPSIANELKTKGQVQPKSFDEVTIYFSDIVGFTVISSSSAPLQVVAMLNHLYTVFDGTIDQFDVYKVETIGDAYMCVSGLPSPNGNKHSREIALMSLALLDQADKFVIPHRPGENLKLRIGLHSGSCVAGVVGLKMPRYCLFGDTVNTASRMESNGEALKIHISNACKLKLDEHSMFKYESRGELEIKGKGKMLTYWLTGSTNPGSSVSAERSSGPTDAGGMRASHVKFDENAKSEFAASVRTRLADDATKSFFSVASFGVKTEDVKLDDPP